jgi:hypothetical protein
MKNFPVLPIIFFFFLLLLLLLLLFLLLASLSFPRIWKFPSSTDEEYNSRLFTPSQSKKFAEKNGRNLDAWKERNLKGKKKTANKVLPKQTSILSKSGDEFRSTHAALRRGLQTQQVREVHDGGARRSGYALECINTNTYNVIVYLYVLHKFCYELNK